MISPTCCAVSAIILGRTNISRETNENHSETPQRLGRSGLVDIDEPDQQFACSIICSRTPIICPEKPTGTAPRIVIFVLSSEWSLLPRLFLQPSTLFWEAKLCEFVLALPPQDVRTLLIKGVRAALSDFQPHRNSSKLCVRFDTLQTLCCAERQLSSLEARASSFVQTRSKMNPAHVIYLDPQTS